MNDSSLRSGWVWALCVVLLFATLLNYMDRQALSVLLPALKSQFNLVESRIGWLEGSFGYSFALGSLLFGLLADRFGPKYLYPAVLVGWSVAGVATSLAGEAWVTEIFQRVDEPAGTGVFRWLLGCRILLGLCEAGHWPCALITLKIVLSPQNRTLGNGILQSGASLGAIIVPLYIEATERAGFAWSFPFMSIGLMGLLWVPFWFLNTYMTGVQSWHPNDQALPDDDTSTSVNRANEPSHEATDNWTHLRKLLTLLIIVATLTISWQFLRAWLAMFLQDHLKYSKEATRILMSGYYVAADVGCIASGLLVKGLLLRNFNLHQARAVGFFVFMLLTACGALVPFTQGNIMLMFLYLTGAGILGLHPYYYALTQELGSRRLGFYCGALAACGWIISSTSQVYLGRVIEETKSYQLGLLLVGTVPFLGWLALTFLWPQEKIRIEERKPFNH